MSIASDINFRALFIELPHHYSKITKIIFNLKYILKSKTLYHGLLIFRIETIIFEKVVWQLKSLT
jgi:hypothetical protein